MSQQIKEIDVTDLILWTENPRDPINPDSTDQDVADRAWSNPHEKWNLQKLIKEMRTHYDFSELPTIVYHGKKPVVYDGNRRIILAKVKHECVILKDLQKSILPEIPRKIPCNVCSKDIAVLNIFRKHADSGTWSPLDRDLFVHKFMREPKSIFLRLDEATRIITSNPHLNKVFVKNEIFTQEKLKELGFDFNEDEFQSRHSVAEASSIFSDISNKVSAKIIDTRKNRGKVLDILEASNRDIIDKNRSNPYDKISINTTPTSTTAPLRQAARTKKKSHDLFNGLLYLKSGQVSDLYRDIVDLYNHYCDRKDQFSQYFPSLIRMSLRLLVEAAASDNDDQIGPYLKANFVKAKGKLNSDDKTTLSTQNVNESTIEQLLHVGAHKYKAANNLEQTVAISLVIGKILEITHGKK